MTSQEHRPVVQSENARAAHISRDCGQLDNVTEPIALEPADEVDLRDCGCVYDDRVPALEDARGEFDVASLVAWWLVVMAVCTTGMLAIAGVVPP